MRAHAPAAGASVARCWRIEAHNADAKGMGRDELWLRVTLRAAAPVAQLDRVAASEEVKRRFETCRKAQRDYELAKRRMGRLADGVTKA